MAFDRRIGSFLFGLAGLAVAVAIAWTWLGEHAAPLASTPEDSTAAALEASHRRLGKSGLPIPRFMSLKAEAVKVRYGPSDTHGIAFVLNRNGMPVEIVAELEEWRRVRDSDGDEGWVLQDVLAQQRTAAVAPWRQGETALLRAGPTATGTPIARLEAGVIAGIESCTGDWCRVGVEGYHGWIERMLLWGVYHGETIE